MIDDRSLLQNPKNAPVKIASILKTPEIGKKFDVKSVMASEIQRIGLNLVIFGYEASLGGHFSRKLALFSGSGEPLIYGRMEIRRSAVSASNPKKRWQATLVAPRTRTNRPPQLSLRFEFTRSTEDRSLNRDFSWGWSVRGLELRRGLGSMRGT